MRGSEAEDGAVLPAISAADTEEHGGAGDGQAPPDCTALATDCARRWPALLLSGDELLALRPAAEPGASRPGAGDDCLSIEAVAEADMRTIQTDIRRTRAGDPVFRLPEMQAHVESLLTRFCARERVRYTQGLHEIAAVFTLVQAAAAPGTMDGTVALACFVAFVRRFAPYYHDGEAFVSLHISLLFFRQLLLYHHPDLHNQLDEAGVSPFVYATPWFMTLFASRTPLHVVLMLWDRFLQRGEAPFMPFLAMAMLASAKPAILAACMDEANLPAVRAGARDAKELEAVWLAAEDLQARTPRSFSVRLARGLRYVKEKSSALDSSAEQPWSERVLSRVERERYLVVMPGEVVANCVRSQRQEEARSRSGAGAAAAAPRCAADREPRGAAEAAASGAGAEAGGPDAGRGAAMAAHGAGQSASCSGATEEDSDELAAAPASAMAPAEPAPGLPQLRLLLLDVRSHEEFGAEHMPKALHFHPPCLRRLAAANSSSGRSRLERLAAALAGSSAGSGGEPGDAVAPAVARGMHWADGELVGELFLALQAAAAAHWGEDWLSSSAAAHLVLLGGAADARAAAPEPRAGGAGAGAGGSPGVLAPLYEALTEQLSLARVSVVLGGAAALHREATKRGIALEQDAPAAAQPLLETPRRHRSLLESARSGLQAASGALPAAASGAGGRLGGLLRGGAGAAVAALAGAAAARGGGCQGGQGSPG